MNSSQSRITNIIAIVAVTLTSSLLPECLIAQPPTPVFSIASIEAKLFYSNSGRFSADVLRDKKFAFWNTPIGEGSAQGSSDKLLLLVTVGGAPGASADDLALRITATTPADTILSRTTLVGEMNSSGRFYEACLLYDVGCEAVTIEAQLLLGDEKGPVVTRLVPFECGE